VMACWNSCLTAMFGAATWSILDYRLAKKWSMVGWCSGCISGLVAATPASGFIPPWASILLGVVTGIVSNFATKIKFWVKIDDSMDVFAEHGTAGMVGLIFNALFAADYIIGLDGVNTGIINGGWVNHNWKQLYVQFAYICACSAWAFVVSAIIAYIINKVPGLHLRASEEAELLGMDEDQLGEFAYDYVEVRRDYLAWSPPTNEPEKTESNVNPKNRHGISEHSNMIDGHDPKTDGHQHTGIQGDRHGIATEPEEEKQHNGRVSNGNGTNGTEV
jgi:Amt family ammonium transporter